MAERTHRFDRHPLGEIDSAGSRQMWTRSSVEFADNVAIAGQWNGTVTAFDTESLDPRWEVDHPESAVSLAVAGETLIVGGRGEDGVIAGYALESGERRWTVDAAAHVGTPTSDRLFSMPYVLAIEADDDGETLYAAARRYERDGDERRWQSAIYGIEPDGAVRWRYETDASPIALSLDSDRDRLAVGYNRCTGTHDCGVSVLDSETGNSEWMWDPETDGDRRVGDVSFTGEHLAVASHGDKRGYLLEEGGTERWTVDLAVETDVDGETLYAYPNHTYANDGYVAFVTGNTYAVDSRETSSRHPNEHRIAAFDIDGEPLWDASVRGFVTELAARGRTVVAPCAQNFRVRDSETHALRWFDLKNGAQGKRNATGIATAAAIDSERIAVIEEPVEYHDEQRVHGEYALGIGSHFV
ncbi:PQQ-binding-like beta-propeller repeat protein [Natrialba sp. SSL1]|uniref:outer membrane protein assembly factor BamB family protein n=1 Tax=Natrialba sp. SSL1 TaxID=1869245 RepID=UPI0008F7E87F|nr:PQQ-binding-like beta-propeller repeat protein [Natrialba sp. SSL1]OIB56972.1 transcriptional regulator [Natrialba sp. SSL1]